MLRNICTTAMLLAVLVISLSGVAQAQGWGGAITAMPASAEVFTVLVLEKTVNLNFGDILSNSSPKIDPVLATNDVGVGLHTSNTAHAAGRFRLSGTEGKVVTITWPVSATLTGPSSTMTWTLAVSGGTTDGARGGATVVSGYTPTLPAGYYYLWVGGDLGTLSGQAPGVYTGSANFEVEYN